MKVEQDSGVKINLPTDLAELSGVSDIVVRLKNFHRLNAGDIFKATVTDIQQNQVSLQLYVGENITAKSLILPDARIGDEAFFAVKDNTKGQMLLEMLRPNGDALKVNIARDALVSAKIYPNAENMKLALTLMENDLPIDAASLQKAVFFHYSAANLPLDRIVFLMKENFPMDAVNVKLLQSLTETGGFAGKLADTLPLISKLEPSLQGRILDKLMPALEISTPEFARALKEAGESILKGEAPDMRNIAAAIKQYLPLSLKNKNSLERLADYFKELHKALAETEKLAAQANGDKVLDAFKQNLRENLTELRQSLEFMDHIGNYKAYMQIPLNINGHLNNAELFVFKDPKNKKNLKETASILIAMDYTSLGRVETFIERAGFNLRFQFRAASTETLKLLGASFSELEEKLAESGYKIIGATYKNIRESFTILDNIDLSENKTAEKKRYSFDMRV